LYRIQKRKAILHALLCLYHTDLMRSVSLAKLKKYHYRLKPRKNRKPNQKHFQPKRNIVQRKIDTYDATGMFEDDFLALFNKIRSDVLLSRNPLPNKKSKKISTVLSPPTRLLMVMHWIRTNMRLGELGLLYGLNKGTVSREIKHIVPKLFVQLNSLRLIRIPDKFAASPFEGAVAAIDCSSHYRNRVHPRQGDYYRGDKHAHFLNAQVVTSLDGTIIHVALGLGHNNDRGMFVLTGMKEYITERGIKLLADRGYSYTLLVTPDDDNKDVKWNNIQKTLRSIVEIVIGLAKNYATAASKFRMGPELQELVLMIVYYLVQLNLLSAPLRTPEQIYSIK